MAQLADAKERFVTAADDGGLRIGENMERDDVQAILTGISGFDLRFEGLLRRALERIPLMKEDLNPLRIFLMGYRKVVATSLACGDETWHHLIIIDRHPLYGRDDEYIMEVMAHEIAHVYLGHGRQKDATGPRLCDEARKQVVEWGFPGSRKGDRDDPRP